MLITSVNDYVETGLVLVKSPEAIRFRRPFCRFGKIAGFRFRAIPDAAIAEKCNHATVVSRYSTPTFIKISALLYGEFEVKSIFDLAKNGKREYALFFYSWLLCENQRGSPS